MRFGHQATHSAKLTNLFFRTTSSGIQHHVNRIKSLVIVGELVHQCHGQLGVGMCPDIDDLVITFVIGDKAHVVIVNHLINLSHGIFDEGLFDLWNNHIIEVK